MQPSTAAKWLAALLFTTGLAAAEPAAVYPDDAYSRPAEDVWSSLETACGVSPGGNAAFKTTGFFRNELVPDDAGFSRWTFRRHPGATMTADLGFNEYIRRKPDAVSMRVRNDGLQPARFSLFLFEMTWQKDKNGLVWVMPGSTVVEPGQEETVRFSMTDLKRVSPEEAAVPSFPATWNLRVEDVADDTDYNLCLSRFTVYYPPATGMQDVSLKVPERFKAGKDVSVEVAAHGKAIGRQLDLELHDGARVLWRARLTNAEKEQLEREGRCRVSRHAPWYLPSRTLTLGLVADGYRAGDEARVEVENKPAPELPQVERRAFNGRPAVFIDGKPFPWTGYATYDFQPGSVSEFGASGADLFAIPTAAGRHIHQICDPTWVAPDRYDFGELDEQVGMALQANPEAFLVMRVSLLLPPFWVRDHPDSRALVRTDTGDLAWEETGSPTISLASEDWRKQQEACLREIIRYCKGQPWSKRVAGFILAGEVTEEWFAWGCNDGFYADYSAPNQAKFREWCQSRGLDAKEIPQPAERNREGYDLYPADFASRLSAEYARYYSELTSQTINHFARIVKDETQGKSLAGAFIGYVVQLAGEPRQHLAGHCDLRTVLDSPDVDFVCGIPLHNFRNLTNGYDTYTSATESILASGKLYLNENDLFSWLHHLIWYTPYDPVDPRGGAISMHQRVFADDVIHGNPRQWFSLIASWHHDAQLQQEFARFIDLQRELIQIDRTPVEEVALVVDETSLAWRPPKTNLPRNTNADLQHALGRTGAPLGVWLLSDLDRLPERIRFVVVAGADAPSPQDKAKLEKLIAEGRRTVLIVGPACTVDTATGQWDLEATRRLTGLPIAVTDAALPGAMKLPGQDKPLPGVETVRPRATSESSATLQYADGAGAFAERPLSSGGRLLWCGAPPLDSNLLRSWLQTAGVHLYAPTGFFVHACRDLVAVTAPSEGEVQLAFPTLIQARDLYDNWTAKGQTFLCPFRAGQTRLFLIR